MKKLWIWVISALVILAGATYWTDRQGTVTADGKSRTKIILWHSMSGGPATTLQKLIDQYNATSKKYVVVPEYEGAYTESLPKILNVGDSNGSPAIFQAQEIATSKIVASNFTVPAQDLVDKTGYDTSQLQPGILSYYTVNNKLQSMPFNSSTPVVYYNKDLLKKYGIKNLPLNPTYDDISAMAKAVKDKSGGKVKGMTFEAYGWLYEELMANAGTQLADNDNGRATGKYATKMSINTPAAKKLLTWITDNIKAGTFVDYGVGDAAETNEYSAFLSGKVAMFVQSSSSIADFATSAKFNVGVTYVPYEAGTQRNGVAIGGASLWMVKNKSADVQAGAWDFITFLENANSQATWSLGTGYIPVNKNSTKLPVYQAALKKNPNIGVPISQLETSNKNIITAGPLVPILPIERTNVESAMEAIYNGADIDSSLKKAEDVTNTALQAYNDVNH